MQPSDLAKLAGIGSSSKIDYSALPSDARQMAMLAGLVPAAGSSTFAGTNLIADEPLPMGDGAMMMEAAPPAEDFARTMARAAGISFDMLEDGVAGDLSSVPPPVAPPVFAPPAGIPLAEEMAYIHPVAYEKPTAPTWAWNLRDAVEGLINKTLTPKDALKAMQEALDASKDEPRSVRSEPPQPPKVVESEEQIFWKRYYNKMMEE